MLAEKRREKHNVLYRIGDIKVETSRLWMKNIEIDVREFVFKQLLDRYELSWWIDQQF